MNCLPRILPAWVLILLVVSGATSCSKREDSLAVPAPAPAIKSVIITVKQRSTTPVPGTDEALRLTIDDITADKVMTSLAMKDGASVLAGRLMSQGEAAAFDYQGAAYRLKLKQLNNALIGEDFATFVIQPASIAFMSEQDKIEHLIQHIAGLKEAKFLRNGGEHSAEEAASHLRKKLAAAKSEIKSADDFVAKVATQSSLTDEPYTLRLSDGRLVNLADYLRAELQSLN
jgi:ABC-type phosphate transport system auxiliary subunit